ncbi:MAG: transcription-repair coupling factor [Planctomycetota bacterium]
MKHLPNATQDRSLTSIRHSLTQTTSLEIGGVFSSPAIYLTAHLLTDFPSSHLLLFATEEDTERALHHYQLFQLQSTPLSLFPFWEGNSFEEHLFSEGLSLLKQIASSPTILFCSLQAFLQKVPSPQVLKSEKLQLQQKQKYTRESILKKLDTAGFVRVTLVGEPGEYALRGSILDIYSLAEEHPYRLEFFGDSLEDIRLFDADTQRSIRPLKQIQLSLLHHRQLQDDISFYSILDYLSASSLVFLFDPTRIEERSELLTRDLKIQEVYLTLKNKLRHRPHLKLYPQPVAKGEGCVNFHANPLNLTSATSPEKITQQLQEEIEKGKEVHLVCRNKLEVRKFKELQDQHQFSEKILLHQGTLYAGFDFTEWNQFYATYWEIFPRPQLPQAPAVEKKRFHSTTPILDFIDLKPGDFIVHLSHGIGQFLGIHPEIRDGILQDFIDLRFANNVEIKLPAVSLALIQKYVQIASKLPKLDIVGAKTFQKRIDKVRAGLLDVAAELLEVQALRDKCSGMAFPPDTEWQKEFEDAFPYELTPDQAETIHQIKNDMESSRPMDRLICGDVGFGKTELAIRAAFKAVSANKQVAFLSPTSILARQHFLTLRERMAEFPITLAYVAKFIPPREQKKILELTKQGKIDILIGTHRLLSKDVAFSDIGLLVIDEEQRFGVEHKEKLKRLRTTVDILTLTATPIPRTLNSALIGLRDISVLATPPKNRKPIMSRLVVWDSAVIRQAILDEMARNGQVFFVHNRVESIEIITKVLQGLVPEARFEIVHGQMKPDLLEKHMIDFLEHRIDVLVATSIIEFGIDIPNVNTLFVHQAERFGLADLHQLRGRIGRSHLQAYAYFIIPERKLLTNAHKRLKAIEEFSQLGAGFHLSMRDLEIRGAGNILGYEQSGHIASIGYELYCQVLKETVALLKHEQYHYRIYPNIKIKLEARIPEDYILESSERMSVYRKLSALLTPKEYSAFEQECLDLYGPFPESFRNLMFLTRLRIHAETFYLPEIYERGPHFIIRYQSQEKLIASLNKQAVIRYPEEQYALCFIAEGLPTIDHLKKLFAFSKI